MRDWRIQAGLLLGFLGAAVVLTVCEVQPSGRAPTKLPVHGPLLPDCHGALTHLVIHSTAAATPIVRKTYRQFLALLPADVTVYIVCPARETFSGLYRQVGPTRCRLVPVVADHAMTCWSRDRWLAFAPLRGRPALLLAPREEAGADLWAERRGDHRSAFDLATALPDQVVAANSDLAFDGGDFVADDSTAFVTPDVVRRNVGHTVASAAELSHRLERLLRKKVVILSEAPPHHAGMFMMLARHRTALVGDPSLARRMPAPSRPLPLAQPDFSEETQRAFDAVSLACQAHGYHVVRIPTVPDVDGRTYLTWLNVILDERAGRRVVYMPVFEQAEPLNAAAAAVWESLGYSVGRVDCTATYRHYGSLRCLVNVLARRHVPQAAPLI